MFQAGGDDYILYGLPSKTIGLSLFGPGIDSIVISYFSETSEVSLVNESRITITTEQTGQIFSRNTTTVVENLKAAFIVVTGVLAIFPICVMGYLFKHQNHAVVVTASKPFIQLTLFASLLLLGGLAACIPCDYIEVLSSLLSLCSLTTTSSSPDILGFNNAGCMIFPWMSGVGFTVMYGSLFAKSVRSIVSVRRSLDADAALR